MNYQRKTENNDVVPLLRSSRNDFGKVGDFHYIHQYAIKESFSEKIIDDRIFSFFLSIQNREETRNEG